MQNKAFKLPPVSPLIGSTFSNFIKVLRGHHIEPRFYPKLALTALGILATSPFRWYDNRVFKSRLPKTHIDNPVFILGHWRSGTTHLHNLMCQDPASGFVNTYQSVFPNFLASKSLFGPFMKRAMPTTRPSDNMLLSIDLPQEEEFGLLNCNPESVYNLFNFPKDFQSIYNRSVRFDGMASDEKTGFEDDYRKLLKKAKIVSGKNRLIIKNPVNTARIAFLNQQYPGARFIHIVRNPYTVYLSAKKFFNSLIPTLWMHKVSPEKINSMIIDLYRELFKDYFMQRSLIDNKLIEVKYRDLEDSPIGVLKNIYTSLNMRGFENALPYFKAYIKEKEGYKKNVYQIKAGELKLINLNWGKYIDHWGYSLPANIEIVG